jgi:two-component system cell cycle sensor histidine kinase/response regulator CckA
MRAIEGADEPAGRVLLIQADDDTRRLEVTCLRDAGWAVFEVDSGFRGVVLATETLPEVIVCDRRLPDLDGFGVIAALAADATTAAIPIVLVSESSDVGDVVAGINAGARDCLVKPFELIELEARCRAALRVSRELRRVTESERDLRLLADNVSELVTTCGMDFVIRYASPSARGMLGREPHELVGRPAAELMHPDDAKMMTPSQLMATPNYPVTVTRRIARADGTFIWCETRVRVVVGSRGDLEILSAARDITDRMATASALAESEAAYRRIVDLASEGILVTDADHIITFANARMGALLGVPAADLVGRSPLDFTDDEGREVAAARIERRREGITDSGEFKFVRGDGTPVWTSINAAPIVDNGTYQGSIGLVSDVTDRRLQGQAVAQSDARYRALLDHLPNTVAIVYDRELRAVFAAGAGLLTRGVDSTTMVGKRLDELVAPEDMPQLEGVFRAALRGEPSTTEFFSHLTGLENMLDVVPVPSPDGGTLAEILVLSRNVGPLKERERERQQHLHNSQRLESLGELAGGIAHDFNNLLMVISFSAELLRDALDTISRDGADLASAMKNMDKIDRAATSAATLTQQLMLFSRAQPVLAEPIDINAHVSNVEAVLRSSINDNIELVIDLAPDLPPVMADTGRLDQVLLNLMVNARDAMPDGGRVTIRTFPDSAAVAGVTTASSVQLEVTDTGTGMPPEVIARAFEPFFTTKTKGRGTGLGLATVYGIVTDLGGTVELDSTVGQGTRVLVSLPRTAGRPRQEHAEPVIGGTGERLLLAEDEEDLRSALAEMLRSAGYAVVAVASGEGALDAWQHGTFDLLITDVIMPGITGRQLADRLWEERPSLRVLFMSGYSNHALDGIEDLGKATEFVAKPVQRNELLSRIRASLDEPELSFN